MSRGQSLQGKIHHIPNQSKGYPVTSPCLGGLCLLSWYLYFYVIMHLLYFAFTTLLLFWCVCVCIWILFYLFDTIPKSCCRHTFPFYKKLCGPVSDLWLDACLLQGAPVDRSPAPFTGTLPLNCCCLFELKFILFLDGGATLPFTLSVTFAVTC